MNPTKDQPPIACTLTAAEKPQRFATMRAIGERALLGSELTESAALLRFRASEETRRALRQVVEAESRCCPFLDFSLSEKDSALLLDIQAPPEAEPVLRELVAAFQGCSQGG